MADAKMEAIKLKKGESHGTCKLCDNPATHRVTSQSGVDAGAWCEQHAGGVVQELMKGVSG